MQLEFLDPLLDAPDITVTAEDGEPVPGLGRAELVADDTAVVRFDPLGEPGRYTVTYDYASLDGAPQQGAHQFTFAAGSGDGHGGLLPVSATVVRLFLHVLAATVWVGGQLVLAGLVPGLRAVGPDAPRAVARSFNRIAWPAYGVLVATGIWNVAESSFGDRTGAWQTTLFVKLLLVAVSGGAALAHGASSDRRVVAVGGALTGTASLAALFLGVQLTFGA